MKWLIAILILAIVLIAGCTQTASNIGAQTGIGVTSIPDLIKNPEIYENKTVTFIGITTMGFPFNKLLTDDQGYLIEIRNFEESGRNFDYGKYKVTGIINYSVSVSCNCLHRYIANLTKEDLEYLQEEYNVSHIYEENITCILEEGWSPIWGYCPLASSLSPEEGWQNYSGSDVLSCNSSTSLAGKMHYKIFFKRNPDSGIEGFTEKIEEKICDPNLIKKNYYFECTEPMIKIS